MSCSMEDSSSQASKRRLSVCVKTVKCISDNEQTAFALLLEPTLGLVATHNESKSIALGQWFLFVPTAETVEVDFTERMLVHDLEETSPRRETTQIDETLQVTAFCCAEPTPVNAYFCRTEDDVLGPLLLAKEDPLVKKCVLNGKVAIKVFNALGENIQYSICIHFRVWVAFMEKRLEGIHWAVIAVNDSIDVGKSLFRKIAVLANDVDCLASVQYDADILTERAKWKDPLLRCFLRENGDYIEPNGGKLQKAEEIFGNRYGFELNYKPDPNSMKRRGTAVVVHKNENAAICYCRDLTPKYSYYSRAVIRRCDFISQSDFDQMCALGSWVQGVFVQPALREHYKLFYQWMLLVNEELVQTDPPAGLEWRIRHFCGYYHEKTPEPVLMFKLPCNFKDKARPGEADFTYTPGHLVSTDLGWAFVHASLYESCAFAGKHLKLWLGFINWQDYWTNVSSKHYAFLHYLGSSMENDPCAPQTAGQSPLAQQQPATSARMAVVLRQPSQQQCPPGYRAEFAVKQANRSNLPETRPNFGESPQFGQQQMATSRFGGYTPHSRPNALQRCTFGARSRPQLTKQQQAATSSVDSARGCTDNNPRTSGSRRGRTVVGGWRKSAQTGDE